MFTRRDFGRLALGALPVAAAAAKMDSVLHGVQFGLQSYSFNGLPQQGLLDVIIKCMVENGLGEVDIFAPLIEPAELWDRIRAAGAGRGALAPAPGAPTPRAEAQTQLAEWRKTAPLDYFRGLRGKFAAADIEIYGYSATPGPTDAEIERTLQIAKAMGATLLTTSSTLSAARRIAPLAEKYEILIGFQGNPNMATTNPDQIARPDAFEAVVKLSKQFRISFDIGDATGGGYDALQFVKDHHEQIALLYIKDRKKDRTSMPWGEGDSPVKETLQLVRDNKYPIRCYVDNDYQSPLPRSEDVRRSYEFARKSLG
jgi:sugar phosphate isomerase/epimerase